MIVEIVTSAVTTVTGLGGLRWLDRYLTHRRQTRLDPKPEHELDENQRNRRKIDKLEAHQDELHKQIATLSGQVERAVATAEALKQRVAELERTLEETERECDALREKLEHERALRAAAEREREAMRATIAATIAERDALERDIAQLRQARTEGTGRHRPLR